MRSVPLVPKLRAYSFPDAKELDGNIFDPCYESTSVSENYAYLTLLHFMNYRTSRDLSWNGSYLELFRLVRNSDHLNKSTFKFLQNMQNQRNHFHIKNIQDELERETEEFVGKGGKRKGNNESMSKEEIDYADFLCSIYDEIDENDVDASADDELPAWFTIGPSCRKGLSGSSNFESEHVDLCDNPTPDFVDDVPDDLKQCFLSTDFVSVESAATAVDDSPVEHDTNNCTYSGKVTKYSLVSLAGRNCRRRIETNLRNIAEIVANGSAESIIRWSEQQMINERGRVCSLDPRQRAAFQCMTASFILTYYKDALNGIDIGSEEDMRNDFLYGEEFEKNMKNLKLLANGVKDNLVMFFSGSGGSGKSECIRQTLIYCRSFCQNLRVKFTKCTIRVTALTGVAAVSINGETIDSAAYLNGDINKLDQTDYDNWAECRLLIVDEVSFMGSDKLIKLNVVLNRLRGNYSAFGGLNIVFCGDFRQLEPIDNSKNRSESKVLYCAEGRGKHLFWDAVNCYVELVGLHRFDSDVEWGRILHRLRNGEPTDEDIELINERLLEHLRHQNVTVPDNARYATYRNRTRDRINSQLFAKRVKESAKNGVASKDHVLIFCDDLCSKETTGGGTGSAKYISFKGRKDFWTNVGESDCMSRRNRFDPVLKLWKYSEVMLTDNDVEHGNANGTQLNVINVVLNEGETFGEVSMDGIMVQAVLAKQIKYVLCYDKRQRVLKKMRPEKSFFKARFAVPTGHRSERSSDHEFLQMRAIQVPFIMNNATTGYKLQGAGVDNIVVTEFAPKNVLNWIYVLLSRVRTRHGLFLKTKIPTDLSLYEIPKSLKNMLSFFSENSTCQVKTMDDLY